MRGGGNGSGKKKRGSGQNAAEIFVGTAGWSVGDGLMMKHDRIENRMVIDSAWPKPIPEEVRELLSESGYHEDRTNTFVPDSQAYEYALERCLHGSEDDIKEFKEMLVDWFYSGGDWRREEADA